MSQACRMMPGRTYRVVGFAKACDPVYRQKLFAMGLVKGVVLQALRVAPLGDPIQIEVRGGLVSLRQKECECLFVEEVIADEHQ